jgi:hypothetical protein
MFALTSQRARLDTGNNGRCGKNRGKQFVAEKPRETPGKDCHQANQN